jgi:hypothetical protein
MANAALMLPPELSSSILNGPSANALGMFSGSTSSFIPYRQLRPGIHVEGIAEADERNVAAVKIVRVISSSK